MWHSIPHMLVFVLATTTWVSQLVLSLLSHFYAFQVSLSLGCTWIWSGTRVAWSRSGLSCPQLVDGAGKRSGSPRRTSTGACSFWSWPAGTQTCAPALDPAQPGNNQTLSANVCVCVPVVVCVHGSCCKSIQTWSSSSTTTNVSRLFLKSSRVILGLKTQKDTQTNLSTTPLLRFQCDLTLNNVAFPL